MLAYQHAYHAGNFADVHKHLTLFAVTRHLLRKESPVTYIDTHAGRGLYPLDGVETQKLKEYQNGVVPLWSARERLRDGDELLSGWLTALERCQKGRSRLERYPGSPWWLAEALRPQDRLSLFELHPGEYRHLEEGDLPNARRIHGDGLAGLTRLLPVATPRLCVLIDPSYERKAEYLEVAETLQKVVRKARHAVVVIWYPLLPAGRHETLLERLRDAGIRKLWRSEIRLSDGTDATHGMQGSGVVILNPPWGLGDELDASLARLVPLWGGSARHRAGWWVGE
ncbi:MULTISPECIES: 23S rRNA (adenine(2030)-N(6))-methyltransferase RlmJ [unclassified Modicisalibacter]|uniref:23S rRNA (adenine(2030)-N(6))-methyltransferase RlmJ n=1 Tax=unclassified Modicisalibacter TaxID=2679913 RepID=UPI001CC8F09A|nr:MULTISPECIES: 23S rRNA (adenine(2030)-N(6))-methyltransferase RlmJ [unclassified Modicisalibacter]MBZ9558686.1 23S rRNA (adenine(2030)-N(6))-methyltransferase RlmJ [Modicisalibacter sp. R2A 31.J]MBZ9575422.1 23S rRNA (adenine(2030)-N(6))-methyltransferase RlmJ [Modicisalibacter sp. MOD 31.J]